MAAVVAKRGLHHEPGGAHGLARVPPACIGAALRYCRNPFSHSARAPTP
ncbi:hypothetical protein [Lysobacter gummosus]